MSIVRYTETRPYVLGINTSGGDLSWLTPPPSQRKRRKKVSQDAVPGGGAGPDAAGTSS